MIKEKNNSKEHEKNDEKDSQVKSIESKKETRKKRDSSRAYTKYKDIEGKFLLVRVGTDLRPATEAQLKDIEEKLTSFLNDNGVNCMAFVTHHAVDISVIGG